MPVAAAPRSPPLNPRRAWAAGQNVRGKGWKTRTPRADGSVVRPANRLVRPSNLPVRSASPVTWGAAQAGGRTGRWQIVKVPCAAGHLVWPVARSGWTTGHAKRPLPERFILAERRFPRPDADFVAYMNNYAAVRRWWSEQGLDTGDLKPLEAALTLWNADFPAHIVAQQRAEAAHQSKDAARRTREAAARPVKAFIQGFPKTTDADRATIGITVRDAHGTHTPTPTTRPQALVQAGQRLTHTPHLTDEATRPAAPAPRVCSVRKCG